MPEHARPRSRIPVAIFAIVLALLGGCGAPPPEQALRASMRELEAAIESREPGSVAGVLADDFAGPGGMDRAAARRLAQLAFLRNREVVVAIGPLDIDLQGNGDDAMHASVRFTAALTGGTGGWLPERGSVYRVETGWRRDGDAWEMTSARWERDL